MQNYNSKYKSDLKERCFRFSLAMTSFPQQAAGYLLDIRMSSLFAFILGINPEVFNEQRIIKFVDTLPNETPRAKPMVSGETASLSILFEPVSSTSRTRGIHRFKNKRAVWIIADQLLRSGTSIGANLIEGSAASSRLEYKKFYEIALKSANETKYWLSLLKESSLTGGVSIEKLLVETAEIASMLAVGVMKLKNRNF